MLSQVHCGTLFFAPDGFYPLGEGYTLTPSLIRPASVGELRLTSANPEDKPAILPNYLSDARDLRTLVDATMHARPAPATNSIETSPEAG